METFAFIHAYVSYENPTPEPQVRSLNLPTAQALKSAGVAIAFSTLSLVSTAQALILPGDTGSAVVDVQRVLQRQGYPISVDGVYGPATRAAVLRFQQQQRLTPDGIIGPGTLQKLGLQTPGTTSTPTSAQPNPAGKRISGYVTVLTNDLRIRSSPNAQGTVIGYLNIRDVVPTTGRVENGFVELYKGGWIALAYTNLGSSKPTGSNPSTTPGKSLRTVAAAPTGLLIRSGPGVEYNIIGTLANGETVEVKGTPRDGWIQLAKGGWVSATYLK